jgi:ATP-dependent DNA ligase
MLPTAAPAPPAAEGWVHESKLDGYRCLAQVKGSRVRLWSRAGTEWTDRLPELASLSAPGEVVLDGEVVVVTPDGRADFELLGARIHGPRYDPHSQPVTFYVFDVLQFGQHDLRDQPWVARRQVLEDLDVAARSGGAAWPTIGATNGVAMHEATRAVQAEGTVSKRTKSAYRPGRSRQWLKAKHKVEQKLQVAGWRPSTPARPGGLILAEHGEPIGVGALAMPERQRVALIDLLQRYGRHHPTGVVTIPADRVRATVHYPARTPTHGHLREAFVVAVEPIDSDGIDDRRREIPSYVPAT